MPSSYVYIRSYNFVYGYNNELNITTTAMYIIVILFVQITLSQLFVLVLLLGAVVTINNKLNQIQQTTK